MVAQKQDLLDEKRIGEEQTRELASYQEQLAEKGIQSVWKALDADGSGYIAVAVRHTEGSNPS